MKTKIISILILFIFSFSMLFIFKTQSNETIGISIDSTINNFAPVLSSGGLKFLSVENENNEKTITATITPSNAVNKLVDWSVDWVNDASAWATGKTVTDYVTVTPTADGALTASVKCLAEFGEQIQITVTSRNNSSAQAYCLCDYISSNLINQTAETKILYGVTFSVQSDGSIKVFGTATGAVFYLLTIDVSQVVVGDTLGIISNADFADFSKANIECGLKFIDDVMGYIPRTDDIARLNYTLTKSLKSAYFSINIKNGVSINSTVYPFVAKTTRKLTVSDYKV